MYYDATLDNLLSFFCTNFLCTGMMCLFQIWGIMTSKCKLGRKRLENKEHLSASFEPHILSWSFCELGQCLCYIISTFPSMGESMFTCVDLDATFTSSNRIHQFEHPF